MAKKVFKGRPLLAGNLKGKALASKQPLNTTGSYIENLFGGNTETAPCTDPNNKEFYGKELGGAIICTTTTVGSTCYFPTGVAHECTATWAARVF